MGARAMSQQPGFHERLRGSIARSTDVLHRHHNPRIMSHVSLWFVVPPILPTVQERIEEIYLQRLATASLQADLRDKDKTLDRFTSELQQVR